MKLLRICALPFLFLLILISSCSVNLEKKVESYKQAHNEHDIDRVMSMYTDDINFEVKDMLRKSGKEQVRGLAEWDQATKSEMIISDIKINGDTVNFKLKEGNDWFRTIGIDYMYYEPCRMVFENGKIKELQAELTEKSKKEFGQAWPVVYQWLNSEKREDLKVLLTEEGGFIYNKEKAAKWLSLLNEWKDTRVNELE